MDFSNQFSKIITDDSLMETVKHGTDSYQFNYYYENMSLFDFGCVDWHWHTELEFVFIKTGTVSVDAADKHIDLSSGYGIMINSKILHRLTSSDAATIPNFLFHPSFISPVGSLIYEKYVLPIITSSTEHIIFSPDVPWQAEVLKTMSEIIDSHDNELGVSSLIQRIWLLIYDNMTFKPIEENSATLSKVRLQMMMQFIHDNYSKNVTLEDIANAANICKSSALHLFQDNIAMTPVSYLINYRLKEAAIHLAGTEEKVAAIAQESGFNSVDYFCRAFKDKYGKTPSEYRKHKG